MKHIVCAYFVLIILCFIACGPKNTNFTSIVDARIKALNAHDTVALKNLYIDTATGESPNWGDKMSGADKIVHQYARNFISVPDLTFQITHINEGTKSTSVEMTMSGTMTNLENGVPAYMQGKKYNLKMCTILEFKDGKISREANYFDQVDFLRQMGFFEQKQ